MNTDGDMRYMCMLCETSFATKRDLNRHTLRKKSSCLSQERCAQIIQELQEKQEEIQHLKEIVSIYSKTDVAEELKHTIEHIGEDIKEMKDKFDEKQLSTSVVNAQFGALEYNHESNTVVRKSTMDVIETNMTDHVESSYDVSGVKLTTFETKYKMLETKCKQYEIALNAEHQLNATLTTELTNALENDVNNANNEDKDLCEWMIYLTKHSASMITLFVELCKGTPKMTHELMTTYRKTFRETRATLKEKWVKEIHANQQYKCNKCKCMLPSTAQTDHVIPLAIGGSNEKHNLQALCPNCHAKKTEQDRDNFARLMTLMHKRLILL